MLLLLFFYDIIMSYHNIFDFLMHLSMIICVLLNPQKQVHSLTKSPCKRSTLLPNTRSKPVQEGTCSRSTSCSPVKTLIPVILWAGGLDNALNFQTFCLCSWSLGDSRLECHWHVLYHFNQFVGHTSQPFQNRRNVTPVPGHTGYLTKTIEEICHTAEKKNWFLSSNRMF